VPALHLPTLDHGDSDLAVEAPRRLLAGFDSERGACAGAV